MKTRILARLVDREGTLLLPPNPSYQLIEEGIPVGSYTLDQIADMALAHISRLRDISTRDSLTDRG